MVFNFNNMDSYKLDALKELSNIGAGNAATALSKLIKRKIDMGVPKIKILEFNEVSSILGSEEQLLSGVMVQISGNIKGIILLILQEKDTLNLLNILTKKNYTSIQDLDEIGRSAICETGNILIGVYMSALASLTGLKIKYSNPQAIIDMAGAILSLPAVAMAEIAENVLYIDSNFEDGQDSIKANIFMVPEGESFLTLLKALGVG